MTDRRYSLVPGVLLSRMRREGRPARLAGGYRRRRSSGLPLTLSLDSVLYKQFQLMCLDNSAMPRGNPRKMAAFRLDPELVAAVTQMAGPGKVTAAVEEGLRWWLARQARRLGKAAAPASTSRHHPPRAPSGAA